MKNDDIVYAIKKFRAESPLQLPHNRILNVLLLPLGAAVTREAKAAPLVGDSGGADIGGHNK